MAKRNRRSRSAKPKMAYAEGGAVDAQMEAMMAEGTDPVSGNEVPTGAMPEEVRDDIDAKLSEGEYVVPADVVRFFGVNFFENLRDKAKQGWAEMEANGRVGGEPVGMEMGGDDLPFDLAELNIVDDGMDDQPEMSDGGWVKGYAVGGDVTQMVNPFAVEEPTSTEEYKTFKNDAGMTLVVRFANGKPLSYIPPGYEEQGTAAAAVSESVASKVSIPTTEPRQPEGGPDDLGHPESVDYSTMDADQLSEALSQNAIAGKVAIGLSAVNPVMGLAARAAVNHQKNQITKAMEALGIKSSDDDEEPSFLGKLADDVTSFFSGIFGAKDETPAAPPGRPSNLGTTTNKGADNQGTRGDNGASPAGTASVSNNAVGTTASAPTAGSAQDPTFSGFESNDPRGGGSDVGTDTGTFGGGSSSSGSTGDVGPSGVAGTSDGEAGAGTDNSGAGDQGMGSGWGGM
jgi:hypothetical protein